MKKMTLSAAAAALFSIMSVQAGQPDLRPMQSLPPPQIATPDYAHCLTQTGSHLKSEDCVSADGHVYYRDPDYNVGGPISWADVLRRDPSIVIGGSGMR